MLIKNTNLYINEKNITTIQPYSTVTDYGLLINGLPYRFGTFNCSGFPSEELKTACIGKMKVLQTQIIKKIEGK